MNYALRMLSYVLLAVALVICLVMAVSRVGWEGSNSDLTSIVNDADQLSLSQLTDLGITAVAVHASILATGTGVSPQSIRNAGLGVVLIVNEVVSPQISESGPFLAWWATGEIPFDYPVVMRLTQNNVPLIAREFAPLDLIQTLWVNGYRNVVRGHEISDADLHAVSFATLVSRWERAVRERGIRTLILTPIPGDTPAQSADYYKEVLSNLTAAGYHPGEFPPLPPIYNPPFVILLHIGLCALLLLILLRLIPSLPMAALLLAGAGASLSLGFDATLLCQIDALLVTILAPIFGVLLLLPSAGTGWRAGVRLILMFTGMSLLGALLLSAFLSQPVFILKVASFRGVKISLLLPPSLALILAYRGEWRELLRAPFRNGHARFGTALLAAGVGPIQGVPPRPPPPLPLRGEWRARRMGPPLPSDPPLLRAARAGIDHQHLRSCPYPAPILASADHKRVLPRALLWNGALFCPAPCQKRAGMDAPKDVIRLRQSRRSPTILPKEG
jgi:hypothetical protein